MSACMPACLHTRIYMYIDIGELDIDQPMISKSRMGSHSSVHPAPFSVVPTAATCHIYICYIENTFYLENTCYIEYTVYLENTF